MQVFWESYLRKTEILLTVCSSAGSHLGLPSVLYAVFSSLNVLWLLVPLYVVTMVMFMVAEWKYNEEIKKTL